MIILIKKTVTSQKAEEGCLLSPSFANRKRQLFLVITAFLLLFFSKVPFSFAGNKPDIISYDATLLEKAVSINIKWQSVEPIILIKASSGRDEKEIEIDPYDNRRNRDGYSGEASILLRVRRKSFRNKIISYVIQIEDEFGEKSRLVTGKIKLNKRFFAGEDKDRFGKDILKGDIREKVIEVEKSHDTPPFLDKIKVHRGPDFTATITARANDDNGISTITMGILDEAGKIVEEQELSNLGRAWEGRSKTFKLKPGKYTAIVIAVDTANNRSQDRRVSFTLGVKPLPKQPKPGPDLHISGTSQPHEQKQPTNQEQTTQQPPVEEPLAEIPQQPESDIPGTTSNADTARNTPS